VGSLNASNLGERQGHGGHGQGRCERCEEHVKGRKRFVADGSVRALDYVGLWTFDSEYITNSD